MDRVQDGKRGQVSNTNATKDDVRKQIIEEHGYPAEASERAAIVAWLRESAAHHLAAIQPYYQDETVRELEQTAEDYEILADAIARGDHLRTQGG